jgi:hypothetical protein
MNDVFTNVVNVLEMRLNILLMYIDVYAREKYQDMILIKCRIRFRDDKIAQKEF